MQLAEDELPAAAVKTSAQDRRLRKVLKEVERRVRELQRDSACDIPLNQKLSFLVAARVASGDHEEKEKKKKEKEEGEEASNGGQREDEEESGAVCGFCQPLVIATSEPTHL